jgi:hypothetical protein
LRNPVPSDLFGGAGATPVPDPELARNLSPWAETAIDGRSVVLVNQELGLFINQTDFMNFAEYLRVNVVDAEPGRAADHARKVQEYKDALKKWKQGTKKPPKPKAHVPFQLTPEGVEYLVSLLWPSQSSANLVLFRGLYGLKHGAFHLDRMALTGG